jgi:hypothetical protein
MRAPVVAQRHRAPLRLMRGSILDWSGEPAIGESFMTVLPVVS